MQLSPLQHIYLRKGQGITVLFFLQILPPCHQGFSVIDAYIHLGKWVIDQIRLIVDHKSRAEARKWVGRDLSLLQITQHVLAYPRRTSSVCGVVYKLCSCAVWAWCGHAISKLIYQMVFMLKEIPEKRQQSAQSVHGTAALGRLKMLWLVHTVDFSAWKLCQSVFRGHIFYTNEIKNWKSPQARSDPCNDGNVAMKDIYAKEIIVDLVTIISHLV